MLLALLGSRLHLLIAACKSCHFDRPPTMREISASFIRRPDPAPPAITVSSSGAIGDRESQSMPCGIPVRSHSAGSLRSCRHQSDHFSFWLLRWRATSGVCHLHLFGMGKQVIVNPTCEDGRVHGNGSRTRKSLHPAVQLVSCCSDFPFLINLAARILEGREALINTDDPQQHRRIVANVRSRMSAVDQVQQPQQQQNVPIPQGQPVFVNNKLVGYD
jgi:hypothetical protein